ncbi:MAG: hypothetical protein IT227_10165 [Flavobacteriales bacterium]|mgnify:FL=1|nr:hypothetical protein [Flavobacteriales bacterium]
MLTLPFRPALMLLTLLFTGPALQAAEPVRTASADKLELAVERALNRHVVFPLLERKHDMTGEVTVSFVVNSEGRLKVLECWSANEPLRQYVLGKLAKVDVGDNPDGIWRTTRVHFVFRPEKA